MKNISYHFSSSLSVPVSSEVLFPPPERRSKWGPIPQSIQPCRQDFTRLRGGLRLKLSEPLCLAHTTAQATCANIRSPFRPSLRPKWQHSGARPLPSSSSKKVSTTTLQYFHPIPSSTNTLLRRHRRIPRQRASPDQHQRLPRSPRHNPNNPGSLWRRPPPRRRERQTNHHQRRSHRDETPRHRPSCRPHIS